MLPHEMVSFARLRRGADPGIVAWLTLAAAIAACKSEPSRWEKAASTPPAQPAQNTPPETAGSAFNKIFPASGTDGFKLVFTQEKTGFAEAKLLKAGVDVATLAISDVATDA